MSITHTAQVLTEMLNNPEYKKVVAAKTKSAFEGWELTDNERRLLVAEASESRAKYSPKDSKTLNYLVHNMPLTEPVGVALANALGRHLGGPVLGPLAGGCDGGCCSWTGRIIFAGDPIDQRRG